MWQSGIKVVDGIQVTNQLTLKRKGYPKALRDWPSAVAVVLKSGGGGKKRESGKEKR